MTLEQTITCVNSLASRLKHARELRGLTQGQLAAAAKCAQSTIGNVEAGTRLSLRGLVTVARVLDVSPEWLAEGKGHPPRRHSHRVAEPLADYKTGRHDWPFSVSFDRYNEISDAQKELIDRSLCAAVEAWEADHPLSGQSRKPPRAA